MVEHANANWADQVLESIRRWNVMGRPDPSPETRFVVDGIRYTFRVVSGKCHVIGNTAGFTEEDGHFGAVDDLENNLRQLKNGNIKPATELRCSDCGALGYEWCPGCRAEVFPGKWGRND